MWTGILVAACAGAFLWRHTPRHGAAGLPMRLGQAYRLLDADRYDEAIELLDAIDTRTLAPAALVQWLNLKANALALVGRCDEAIDLIDDLTSLADEDDATMQLCAVGNRAIALLHAGRLDEAEPLLDDTARRAEALREHDAAVGDAMLAETWWWRAELARRQGDDGRRRDCLTCAAALPSTPFGARARHALEPPAPPPA